jgi:hypothetical protein
MGGTDAAPDRLDCTAGKGGWRQKVGIGVARARATKAIKSSTLLAASCSSNVAFTVSSPCAVSRASGPPCRPTGDPTGGRTGGRRARLRLDMEADCPIGLRRASGRGDGGNG